MVEPCRLGYKMPFSYYGSLVSALLQQFRECLLRTVENAGIVGEAIRVAMLACEHAGAAGTAERVCHKTVCKLHSVGCNAVDVGSAYITVVVRTDCLIGVIVAHDEEDVHSLLLYLFLATYYR